MNKNIIRSMVFMMIITFVFPIVSEGVGYVREIDAEFNDLDMLVEGKHMNTDKEPFIYEEKLWIPLSHLARELGLDYRLNMREKAIYLDSKGKLENIDDSKTISSFQTGYQVEAKERIKESLEDEIYTFEKDLIKGDSTLDEGIVRNLQVYFGDVKIFLDNKEVFLKDEPLYYDDEVYVNVMDIGSYLYITPTLDYNRNRLNIDANGVLLDKDHYSEIDHLVSFRNGRNYLLSIQLENLEKRKELYEKLEIPYKDISSITTLEKHLNKHLSKVEDLTFDIDIRKSLYNRLNITFSFPRNRRSRWRRLNRKDVEDYVWDVYSAILILYDEDISIKGQFENPYYRKHSSSSHRNYVTFKSENQDLSFNFSNSNLKRDPRIDSIYLADILNKNLDEYNNIEFEYTADQNKYNVDLNIEVDSKNFFNRSIYRKIGYLKRLNYEIKRTNPDLSIDGTIYYDDDYDNTIRFNIENDRIRSIDLLRETENYLDRRYNSFSYRGHDFGLEYNIYERDEDEFKLVVEGDFSITDDEWIRAGNTGIDRLNNRVEKAVDHIESLWDMKVFVEIVDEDMREIE